MEKDRYEYNYLNRNLKKYVSFKKQIKFLKTILVEDALESKSKIIYSNEANGVRLHICFKTLGFGCSTN